MRWTSLRAFWLALVLAAITATTARAAPLDGDVVVRARALGLARSTPWLRLVHYRTNVFGARVSDVDGKEFFLSPSGKTDPEAELEATLRAFEAPVVPGREDAHALCRFPARRLWLDGALGFSAALHAPRCPALERDGSASSVTSVAVVYSADFLADPASALGHTFLRLKRRLPPGSTESAERFDYGVDFAAVPSTKNPLAYAFEGMAGAFPGFVRFHSFEEKLREYGNRQARDLWEYELALSPFEVTLLVLHLRELAATHIDYFYFSKNCSYVILAAIEAAAPRVDLVSRLNAFVLPKDTIKALFTTRGLVRSVDYRPSLRSEFRAQVSRLTPREKALAERLTSRPEEPLPADLSLQRGALTLDAAVEVLDARFAARGAAHDPEDVAARAALIRRRAMLSTSPPPAPPIPAPVDKAPEKGHGSLRLTLGTGGTSRAAFTTVGFRLALHDLADPPDGVPELSQVQFLDTHLRYDIPRREVTVDSVTFAELLALNPITRFEDALSWRARAFGMRLHDRGCSGCFAHGLDAAVGGTLATEDEHAALFVMADAYVVFSGALDGILGSFVRVGVGPYAGARVRLARETIGVVTVSGSYLPAQRSLWTYDLRASVRTALATGVALGVEAAAQPLSVEGQLSAYFYF